MRIGNGQVADGELLARFAARDPDAAETIMNSLAPSLYRVACGILRDHAEAEDVVQEAMLRLWKAAPGWKGESANVRKWLYRVTTNLCFDRLRARRHVCLDACEEPRDDAPDVSQQLEARDRSRILNQAIGELPERQRIAVVLRHLEQCSNAQVAEIMGTSIGAVESLLVRGRRTLRESLAGRREELVR